MIKSLMAVIIVLPALLLLVACTSATGKTTSNPETSTPAVPPSNNVPTASTVPPGTIALTSVITSKSIDGLALSLSLNSTSLHTSQEITVTVDEQNTLADVNNVPAADDWLLNGLSLGP